MESYTEKESMDKMSQSVAAEDALNLESVKYDDKRLQDPLFCKRVAAALAKEYLLENGAQIEEE